MLFYIKCPSCSRIISNNLDGFDKETKMIEENPIMTKREKEVAFTKLLKKYGFEEICCVIRIMGKIPYHEIVVT